MKVKTSATKKVCWWIKVDSKSMIDAERNLKKFISGVGQDLL